MSDISSFLRELADNIDNNTISKDDFLIAVNAYKKFHDNNRNMSENDMKYYTLGWYIYEVLKKNNK